MTSIIQPSRCGSSLAERLHRHEPLLGALLPVGTASTEDTTAELDFVVVRAHATARSSAVQRLPVLAWVTSSADVRPALEAGAHGVIAEAATEDEARAVVAEIRAGVVACVPAVIIFGPTTLASVDGVDAVLASGGYARLVTSSAGARQAFSAGAGVIVYDLSAMWTDLLSTLSGGRCEPHARQREREPLVLLSGMLGDASLWDGVAARLGENVLPWPARIDLDDSVPEMAETVLAQAPARFALAGHSLGAIVALEMMRQAPQRITRVALVNASGRGPVAAQQAAWSRWRQRTLDGEFEQIASELALETLAVGRRGDAETVAANARMAHRVGPDGFVRQLTAQSARPDSLDSLGTITVPVLVVSGGADEICPPVLQHELAEHCRNAQLVSIDGGHMLPLECPDAVAAHLSRWLRQD